MPALKKRESFLNLSFLSSKHSSNKVMKIESFYRPLEITENTTKTGL